MKPTNIVANIIWIRRLLWWYFWLLIFEGALRKWVVPSLSNPLLIVRDPIVVAIYLLALRSGFFPRNSFTIIAAWLGVLTFISAVLISGIPLPVAVYGWRTDFLHIPLIFVIGRVWNRNDVIEVGRKILWLSLPMAALMVMQFRAASTSWLNVGAGGGKQIDSALGHVRPAATFSFISGPLFFFACVAAFLFYSQFVHRKYPLWLLCSSALAVASATLVSGSRSSLVAVAIVALCAIISSLLVNPSLIFRWFWIGACSLVLAFAMPNVGFVKDGLQTMGARLDNAGRSEGGAAGFANRGVKGYLDVFTFFVEAPFFGYGLGLGTNAGASFLTGQARFLLPEDEWGRVVMESGPFLGGAFLLLRIGLALWLGRLSYRAMQRSNVLPFLLFGVGFINILSGQMGQPTTQGFTILICGLCLASLRIPLKKQLVAVPANAPEFKQVPLEHSALLQPAT